MNSLEFIEYEIKIIKKKIKELKEEEDLHWNYEHEDEAIECDFQIEEYEDILKIFQQIKEELEAWKVVKNKSVDMHDIIHCSSLEVFNCCLYKDYQLTEQEYKIIKKAIEVKDDK